MAIKFLALAALFFYALCWFTHQPTEFIHYVGVSLPWLSILFSIPIHLIVKSKADNSGTYWAYTYIIMTIIYVVSISLTSGKWLQQVPHLATCVTFVAYFKVEMLLKGLKRD